MLNASYRVNLREILAVDRLHDGWTPEDVTRVKIRLWLVLRAQNRPAEAAKFYVDLAAWRTARGSADHQLKEGDSIDEEDMALLDADVSLAHGRTAGRFSNGLFW